MSVTDVAARTSVRRRSRPEPARRTVERRSIDGAGLGQVELAPDVFGIEPNVALLHQVVTAQLAAARAGTQSTRTRAEVAGGGAKPFRQKGTGRGRQGSIRAPHYVGGGIALGPKPRSYRQRTPKKMIRLALHSALSDRAAEGRVALVDAWSFDEPKTKQGVAALQALGLSGRALVVGEERAEGVRHPLHDRDRELRARGGGHLRRGTRGARRIVSPEDAQGALTLSPDDATAVAESAAAIAVALRPFSPRACERNKVAI